MGNESELVHGVVSDTEAISLGRNSSRSIGVSQVKKEWARWSIFAFASLTLCSWETSGTLIQLALINGGPADLLYGCIIIGVVVVCIYASLAEMASMYPVAGAVYVWSAQFAPQKYRCFTSYVQGWLTVMSWTCAIPAVAQLMAIQVQGLILLFHPSLGFHNWHTCLIMITLLSISCILVTFGRRLLTIIVSVLGILHVVLCFCIIVAMLLYGTRSSNNFVWESSYAMGGWSNPGVGFCVGFLTMCFALMGSDVCAHLAEETTNAAIAVPRAMVYSATINVLLAFAFIVVALYSITNVDVIVESPFGLPLLEIFRQASLSAESSAVFAVLMLVPYFGSLLTIMASSGRLTWAFARDGAIRTSEYFSKIDHYQKLPFRAIVANYCASVVLSLVIIGSPVIFNALVSFVALTFFGAYLLPIALFLRYRLVNKNIVYGPWRLGRLGIPINVISLLFGTLMIVFLPFPLESPVTWSTMNYAGPVLGLLLLLAILHWFTWGRKNFKGPIVHITLESHSGEDNETFTVLTREPWIMK